MERNTKRRFSLPTQFRVCPAVPPGERNDTLTTYTGCPNEDETSSGLSSFFPKRASRGPSVETWSILETVNLDLGDCVGDGAWHSSDQSTIVVVHRGSMFI